MKDNDQQITPELMRNARLVFYPKTAEEAEVIQRRLIAMGARWANGAGDLQYMQESVSTGILSENGTLYYNPNADSRNLRATVQQLDPDYIPEERRFLMEQFGKINARIDELAKRVDDMSQKVDHMHDEMFPTTGTTKPKLKGAVP